MSTKTEWLVEWRAGPDYEWRFVERGDHGNRRPVRYCHPGGARTEIAVQRKQDKVEIEYRIIKREIIETSEAA